MVRCSITGQIFYNLSGLSSLSLLEKWRLDDWSEVYLVTTAAGDWLAVRWVAAAGGSLEVCWVAAVGNWLAVRWVAGEVDWLEVCWVAGEGDWLEVRWMAGAEFSSSWPKVWFDPCFG